MFTKIYPPSADESFLNIAIPDLSSISQDDPLIQCRRDFREQTLLKAPDSSQSLWLTQAASLWIRRGRLDEALETASRALQRSFHESSISSACSASACLTVIYIHKGNLGAAEQTISQLRLFAEDADSQKARGLYQEICGVFMIARGADASLDPYDCFSRALKHYESVGDVGRQIRCHEGLASSHSYNGMYLPALEAVEQGLRLCDKSNDWRYTGRLLLAAALAFRDQGYRRNLHGLFDLALDWLSFVPDELFRIKARLGASVFDAFVYGTPEGLSAEAVEAELTEVLREAESLGAMMVAAKARIGLNNLFRKMGQDRRAEDQRVLLSRIVSQFSPAWLPTIDQEDVQQSIDRRERFSKRLRESVEGITDPFLIFDSILKSDGTVGGLLNEFRNSAANSLLKMAPTDVFTVEDLLRWPVLRGIKEPLFIALSEHESYEDEVKVEEPSGETKWFVRRIVPAGDGAVLTLRDSSITRRVEDALRAAATEARQAHLAKSEFLANVSHEIRTPIHGVLGLARALADTELTDDQQRFVNGIISSGDILLNVIGDVLDLSKMEAGRMDLVIRQTHLRELIDNVISLHKAQANEKGLSLNGSVGQNVPLAADLDEGRIRQVLGNLVGNAIKFTKEGGVGVFLSFANNQLAFEVADSGIGISSDRVGTIFEAFRQGSHESASYVGGTGLGLTISRRFVELMGGSISVVSQPSTGSIFRFEIPFTSSSEAQVMDFSRGESEGDRLIGKRILLVEDNAVNVMIAEALLEKLGTCVTTAGNGLEALGILAGHSFDAILMDMRMPVMDGLAATREIRSREEGTGLRVPIIALTAGALAEERSNCFASGMDDFVAKPFTFEVLKKALAKWL